jgi:serine protease Do
VPTHELRITVSMMQPGETVRLKISRNGGTRDLSVKLGELPNSKEGTQNQHEGASKESLEGVSIENLDADTAKELGLPASAKGVVINSIDASSPKADSGLRKGDVIQEVNHKPVHNVAEFRASHAQCWKRRSSATCEPRWNDVVHRRVIA